MTLGLWEAFGLFQQGFSYVLKASPKTNHSLQAESQCISISQLMCGNMKEQQHKKAQGFWTGKYNVRQEGVVIPDTHPHPARLIRWS